MGKTYSHECPNCGDVFESYINPDQIAFCCRDCGLEYSKHIEKLKKLKKKSDLRKPWQKTYDLPSSKKSKTLKC